MYDGQAGADPGLVLGHEPLDALGEVLFGTPNGSAGDPTPVKHLSDPDRLAVLKAELQEKLLLRRV
jgi:hypothetical protein